MLEVLYGSTGDGFLAKIAVELEQALAQRAANGTRGDLTQRVLAQGDGWGVADVMCTSGPQDRSFEEQHSRVSIVIVLAGRFPYRGPTPVGGGGGVMAPSATLVCS